MINCLIMFSCGQFMYLVLTIWLMRYFGKLVKSDERCKDGEDWNINYFQESKGKKSQHFSTWRSLYVFVTVTLRTDFPINVQRIDSISQRDYRITL